jgi:ATPase
MPYTFLPDTSVIYNRKIITLIKDGSLTTYQPENLDFITQTEKLTIFLSLVVLAEVENQANQTKPQETLALDVIRELHALKQEGIIDIKTCGTRPQLDQIKLNPGGELDALIRKDALNAKAILITADEVQSSIALIEGIDVLFTTSISDPQNHLADETIPTNIEDFFDDKTMSVHLRGHVKPMAKKGRPGQWELVAIQEEKMTPAIVAEIANRITRQAKNDDKSFIERNEPGVSVIQLRKYRIVICRPPFSNTYEITAVRPLVSLSLEDYHLPRQIFHRLEVAEGILVAGAPGAGKSTFISALATFYLSKNKLVKTLESVRDLDVPQEVSQYGPLNGSLEDTADILLLIRPDFTFFDEVRTSNDFKIFADMRLAGVGLVGVVHASKPVDAIQRFIRRVELGVIPNVVDTVIFIQDGEVKDVLSLQILVKKPTGFADRDLARPVIEIRDFLNNELLYELYEFGSNVVVTPVGSAKHRYQRKSKSKYDDYPKKNRYRSEMQAEGSLRCSVYRRSKSYILAVDPSYKNTYMHFYANGRHLFDATLNKFGEVSIKTKNPNYSRIQKALRAGDQIEARLE